jgi:hypothetical protein
MSERNLFVSRPRPYLTVSDVLAAHAQFGRLDRDLVKKGMGENWPREWDKLGDDSIFEPTRGTAP